jgi:hypothetical protein
MRTTTMNAESVAALQGEALRHWFQVIVPNLHFNEDFYDDHGYPTDDAPDWLREDFSRNPSGYDVNPNAIYHCPGCKFLACDDHTDLENTGSGLGFAGGRIHFTSFRCGFTDVDESDDIRAAY